MLLDDIKTFYNSIVPITSFPAELQILTIGALPFTGGAAIPHGIFVLQMDPFVTFFWAVLGNLIPNLLLFIFLPIFSDPLKKRWKWWANFLHKTRENNSVEFHKRGALFIFLFVAIPFPGSGSWTGSTLCYIFGLPFWKGFSMVGLGVVAASLFILGASTGIFALIKNLLLG